MPNGQLELRPGDILLTIAQQILCIGIYK